MKLQATTLSALMMLTTACAPVDNDHTAGIKNSDAKISNSLRVEPAMTTTFLKTIRETSVTNLHVALDAPNGVTANDFNAHLDVDSDVTPVDDRFIDLDGDDEQVTIDPDAVHGPDIQNVGQGECMALGFGGDTSGRIINSKDLNIDFAKGVTIEGWIRIDNKSGTILSKQSGAREAFWTVGYDDGQLQFTVGADETRRSVYAAEFPAGEWFHFSILRGETVDGDVEIYIDGVEGTEQLENAADEINVVNPHPVVIGQSVNGDAGNFKGAIASLHIARDVWHSDDFAVETDMEAVETTLGLWDFTQVNLGMVENEDSDDYTIRLRGPIYTEHATICN